MFKSRIISKKRMMLEIAAEHGAFRDKMIYDIGIVRIFHELAVGIMKRMSHSFLLQSILHTVILKALPEQWLIRK